MKGRIHASPERKEKTTFCSKSGKKTELDEGCSFKVAPESKLAVLSLSASMAPALKSARRPRKNEKKMDSQFRNIPTQRIKLY